MMIIKRVLIPENRNAVVGDERGAFQGSSKRASCSAKVLPTERFGLNYDCVSTEVSRVKLVF